MNIISNNYTSINKIPFQSRKIQPSSLNERAPFYPETEALVDKVYNNYRKSLKEVSFNEIRTTALDVSKETQTPKKDVLKAMQLLTQFSNMNDLKIISKEINKAKVEYLGNEHAELCYNAIDKGFVARNTANISHETGVHKSLAYLLDRKKLAPFEYNDSGKIGIVLDDEKIRDLEKVKKTQPEEFENFVKDKNIKFFYISGWDSGISIADRTKNLKEKTVALLKTAKEQNLSLEQAIDYPYMDRIANLGIKPTVIKNENEANEISVYNQMRPEQIRTKDTFYNVIEANTLERFCGFSDKTKALSNHVSAKYLDDTLSVYTFEKMSQDLKTMHEKINEYAKDKNKEPIYVIPNKDIKSSDFINYSYKKINNIEPSKFIYMNQLPSYFKYSKERTENSLIVILDDCALSGGSMRDILSLNTDLNCVKSSVPVLFANLKCSDEALINFENTSSHPVDIMYVDKIKSHRVDSEDLKDVIGEPQYKNTAYSLVFPYMAPDNNSEFATNIALLHNSKYNSSNFSTEFQRRILKRNEFEVLSDSDKEIYERLSDARREYSYSTKNISEDVLETSAIYARTIGLKPIQIENRIGSDELEKRSSAIYSD